MPGRPGDPGRPQAQDRADVRRGHRRRGRRAGRAVASTTSPRCCTPRAWTRTSCAGSTCRSGTCRLDGVGRPAGAGAQPAATGADRAGGQVRRPAGRLPVGDRGAAGRRVRAPGQGRDRLGAVGRAARPRPAPRRAVPVWTACWCRAGSACGASRARSARSATPGTRGIPMLGLCLGLQCMVIEVARDLAGLDGANSAEFDDRTQHPVIATMADQDRRRRRRAGHGRHDAARRVPGEAAARLAGGRGVRRDRGLRAAPAPVRGQQRLPGPAEPRPAWCSPALSPDGHLVEFVELPRDQHPFFVGTQAHPEFKSRPTRPHPLFSAFVARGAGLRRGRAAAGRAGRDVPRRRAVGPDGHGDHQFETWLPARTSTGAGHRAARRRGGDARRQDRTGVRWWSTSARSPSWRWTIDDRVVLIHQYRHPLGRRMWELPAGLLDVAGEEPVLGGRSGSWPRRPVSPPGLGRCWWTWPRRRASPTRWCGCSWPAT